MKIKSCIECTCMDKAKSIISNPNVLWLNRTILRDLFVKFSAISILNDESQISSNYFNA